MNNICNIAECWKPFYYWFFFSSEMALPFSKQNARYSNVLDAAVGIIRHFSVSLSTSVYHNRKPGSPACWSVLSSIWTGNWLWWQKRKKGVFILCNKKLWPCLLFQVFLRLYCLTPFNALYSLPFVMEYSWNTLHKHFLRW